jgi:hypothetical protein
MPFVLHDFLALVIALVAQKPPVPVGQPPRPDVLKTICASEFGRGMFARVDVFHDASGVVAVLALRPDITQFSHAPHTYFGPDGASLLVVPDRPVTDEERRTDPVLRKQEALLRNLTNRRSESCDKLR